MANEINLKDYIVSKTKLPIYLKELLVENDDITLVFLRGKLNVNYSASDLVDTFDLTSNTSHNLTGCPLEVDLSVTANSLICEPRLCKINSSDGHCKPMNINLARKFNNHYTRHLRKDLARPRGVYSICDASDKKNTVVLGSHVSADSIVSRTLVLACGSVEEFWTQNIMDRMLDQHIKNVGDSLSKIETKVNSFYEVYGYKLDSTHTLETTYHSGYIGIEAEWSTDEFSIPKNGALINMFLQVVTGNENSLLYSVYQKLILLQNCTNLLRNGNLSDDSILCTSLDIENDMCNKLSGMLHEVFLMKANLVPQNIEQALAYIEDGNLTDKLWNILSCSNKLVDLKDAINFLFSMIDRESLRVRILDDDLNTTLGNIIKNIYEGKMLVPTLTSKQALELLIELGLQKVIKKIIFVVKSYDFSIGNCLNEHWSKLSSDSAIKSKRGLLENLNFEVLSKCVDFFYSAYIMLEFLQLVEQNCEFSKEVGICVLKCAYSKYVQCENHLVFSEIKQLFDLVSPVAYKDIKLATDGPPLKWMIKMTSIKRFPWYCSITTLFHYSRKPIFPENVYKYKEAEFLSDDYQKYFVIQVSTSSDKLPV